MFATFSPSSDFKRYYRGRMPRLAFIVILLMPLMYGALYLWAFWDPFGHANKIPVALINLDQGATLKDKKVDAGKDVVKGLIDSKQLDLHAVSEADGTAGLAHGEYGWTITIPEDFSESLVSAATGEPRQANLIFTYDETNNYLATIIGQDAAEEVINQVSAQVGQQVFSAVVQAAETAIPKVQQGAAGVKELNDGMQQVNEGAIELSTNLVTAMDGGRQISGALDEIVGALDGAIGDAETVVLNSGISGDEVRAAAQQVTNGVAVTADTLNGIAAAQNQAAADIQGVIADLKAAGLNDAAAKLEASVQKLEGAPAVEAANAALADAQAGANVLNGELANPNSRINVVMRVIESGKVINDLNTVQAKANELRSGADQLSSGLDQLSSGADKLAAGTPALSAGTKQLNDTVQSAMLLIPHWGESETTSFIDALAEPVKLVEKTDHEAKTFAYGFAPFFFGLALFVGAIIAWMLFTPLLARPLAQGLGSFRTVLASYAPTLAVGFVQATILFLVCYLGLGLKPEYAIGTALFMWLMVAMFMAMIQMFNALFGPAVGRVTTLAFLMVMLTSAGGIYPVPVTSPLFQWIHPFDPMTYTVTGLRQLIMGGIDYRLGIAIAVIVGLTAAFLAVSTWAARRNRQYNMDRLYPPVEV